jgi:hypothetical protein
VLEPICVRAPEDDSIDGCSEVGIAQVRVAGRHSTVPVSGPSLQAARLDTGHCLIACERMAAIVKLEILDSGGAHGAHEGDAANSSRNSPPRRIVDSTWALAAARMGSCVRAVAIDALMNWWSANVGNVQVVDTRFRLTAETTLDPAQTPLTVWFWAAYNMARSAN